MKKNGLVNNLLWKFSERITAQLVTLVVSIVLARLLEPEHYGIIAIVTIFITLANVFVSDGFGSALIQKLDADELDFFSVLYFNLAFAVLLYSILFFSAPYIALFYGDGYEILTPVLRVISLRLILSAINSVQQAYVSKRMLFRKFFWSTLFGTIASAIVGIAMAYKGFGVWALVAQYLTNTTVDTLVLNRTMKFRLKFIFSFQRLKGLLAFGAGMLGTKLLITGYQELRGLLIGKFYSSADLAYFDKAKQFPSLIVTNIDSSIGAVLFPKMAKEQNDPVKIKESTRMSIRFSAFIMCPMMMGFAAVAEPFVKLVLTEKWLPSVPLIRILCVVYLFQPIHTANMQAIKAIGRSDICLKLEMIKKTIELICLVCVVRISVYAIAVSMAVMTVAFIFVNAIPNSRLLNYGYMDQIKDLCPSVAMSLIMVCFVSWIGKMPIPIFPLLIIQIFTGGIIYIVMAALVGDKEFRILLAVIQGVLGRKSGKR